MREQAESQYKKEGLAYHLHSVSGTEVGTFMFPFEALSCAKRYSLGACIKYRGVQVYVKYDGMKIFDDAKTLDNLNAACARVNKMAEQGGDPLPVAEKLDWFTTFEARMEAMASKLKGHDVGLDNIRADIECHTTAIIKLQQQHEHTHHA